MMDYAFIGKDLRVKKGVSDMKLCPLFWGRVLGKKYFSQVVELIHPQQFRRCVSRYRGDYKVKAFSCWDQFLCMAFAQLTFRESLRDIEDCLKARSDQLYHLAAMRKINRVSAGICVLSVESNMEAKQSQPG